MCLITFAYNVHPEFPLIVVANRDEFYDRPSEKAHFWDEEKTIFAGKDLQSGGTWLGVTKDGNFAAVTNYRDPSLPDIGEKSRGTLVSHFLQGVDVNDFLHELQTTKSSYGGYNFIGYCNGKMIHYNNILDEGGFIEPGIHAVSNASLNTPWPKVEFAKKQLSQSIQDEQTLSSILFHKEISPDTDLPDTGVGIYLERILSAPFVQTAGYGTRSTACLWVRPNHFVKFTEHLYEHGMLNETNTTIISSK